MKEEQVPKSRFANVPGDVRLQMMVDNCYNKEQHTYQKEFAPDEIEVFKGKLSDAMISLNALNDEIKEKKAEFKKKVDPIKKSITGLLDYIKHKSRQVSEEVYLFDHQKEGLMAAYNSEGELVFTRKLLPSERQMKMRVLKTGTEE
jgi:hypothetical protein